MEAAARESVLRLLELREKCFLARRPCAQYDSLVAQLRKADKSDEDSQQTALKRAVLLALVTRYSGSRVRRAREPQICLILKSAPTSRTRAISSRRAGRSGLWRVL